MALRQFHAAHLEIKKSFTKDFATHPYEAGWASEAIFFVMVEDVAGENSLFQARVQISHDGIHWVDEGSTLQPVGTKGLSFIRVRHFGNWLRLDCRITGKNPVFKLNLQIALKE